MYDISKKGYECVNEHERLSNNTLQLIFIYTFNNKTTICYIPNFK